MKRTDLAIEAITERKSKAAEKIDDVSVQKKKMGNVVLTSIEIKTEEAARQIGKPVGNYATIEAADIKYNTKSYENTCRMIAEEIKKLHKSKKDDVVLVVGLGNRDITPDALGTETVSQIIVTNHLKEGGAPFAEDLSSVCAIAPGVLGTTGMESLYITRAVAEKLKPDLIIVVDALAAAKYSSISRVFQLSNSGIAPGSGVGNNREAFTKEVLGADLIAIGVPTVVDMKNEEEEEADGDMFVTPRDIDLVIKRCAKTVANGINLALHENLSLSDIEEFIG